MSPLISATYFVDQAVEAYETLKNGVNKPLMVLLSYQYPQKSNIPVRVVRSPKARSCGPNQIRIAVVGAGSFAKGMHLPNLAVLRDYFYLQAIVSRTGHNAMATAVQFGANYATTDYQQVLKILM